MTKFKILALFACHTNCLKKYFVNLNNIYKLLPYIDNFAFIDSESEILARKLKNDVMNINKYKDYIFKANDQYLDFGKWVYGLENINHSDYDYVLLINDSIIIIEEIKNYFHYLENLNKEINLYAYNDSSQLGIYHYQSYFFSLNKKIIKNFIDFYYIKKPNIVNQRSLIENMELNLIKIDSNYDCFLKIGREWNVNKNIYWENEELYKKMINNNKFHIFKLKKIVDFYTSYKYDKQKITSLFNNKYYINNYSDLNFLDDGIDHFKTNGFSEGRKCTNKVIEVLPDYYQEKLKNINLYCLFGVPDDFDIYHYKNNNDLTKLKNVECINHYYNEGNEKDYDYLDKNNNLWNIEKNKLYSRYLKNIYGIDFTFPDDFSLHEYSILNQNNKGIINNLIVFSRNKNKLYNFENIKNNINIDNLKKIFKELSDKTEEEVILFYIKKLKNINFKLPVDFDYNVYLKMYDDVSEFTDKELIEDHYKYIGYVENRLYNMKNIDIKDYKKYYDDISNLSNDDAIKHYFKYGFKEKRIYKLPNDFDLLAYKFYNIKDLLNKSEFELKKHYFNVGCKKNLNYKLPIDFNLKNYKSLHEQLINYNDNELKKHYILYGSKVNMIYKIPDDFNEDEYKNVFTYLKDKDKNFIIKFFYDTGYRTNKIYKPIKDFNPNIYKNLYDDLENLTDIDAYNHFYLHGLREKRIYKLPDKFDINLIKKFLPKLNNLSTKEATRYFMKNNLFTNRLKKLPYGFNEKLYKFYNKDLKHLDNNLLKEHYLLYGYKEKRKYYLPYNFNLDEYIELNSELSNSSMDKIIDHIIDNKIYNYELPVDFSCQNYKKFNKSLSNLSDVQLKKHYLKFGEKNKLLYKIPYNFDLEFYRISNKDLDKLNNKELLNHFLEYGYKEGRKYSSNNKKNNLPHDFNFENYRKMNPELFYYDDYNYLKNHYLNFGKHEGKLYKLPDDFDPIMYKRLNPDLMNLSNNDLKNHFINFFFKENRKYKFPEDFNHSFYNKIYFNNINMNNYELEDHFINIGSKRNFMYKIPKDFNVIHYRKLNQDLDKLNDDQLYFHYFNIGIHEKRIYK